MQQWNYQRHFLLNQNHKRHGWVFILCRNQYYAKPKIRNLLSVSNYFCKYVEKHFSWSFTFFSTAFIPFNSTVVFLRGDQENEPENVWKTTRYGLVGAQNSKGLTVKWTFGKYLKFRFYFDDFQRQSHKYILWKSCPETFCKINWRITAMKCCFMHRKGIITRVFLHISWDFSDKRFCKIRTNSYYKTMNSS